MQKWRSCRVIRPPTSQNTATRDLAVESLVNESLQSNWNAVHPHLLIATPLAMAANEPSIEGYLQILEQRRKHDRQANAVTRLTVFLRDGGGHDHFGRQLAVNVIGIQAAKRYDSGPQKAQVEPRCETKCGTEP